jgi:hypothetical protein
VEAYGVVRCRESHVSQTIGSQMAVTLCFIAKYLSVLISVTGRVNPGAMVLLEGLGTLKKSVTPSGVEPTTFRLRA